MTRQNPSAVYHGKSISYSNWSYFALLAELLKFFLPPLCFQIIDIVVEYVEPGVKG